MAFGFQCRIADVYDGVGRDWLRSVDIVVSVMSATLAAFGGMPTGELAWLRKLVSVKPLYALDGDS